MAQRRYADVGGHVWNADLPLYASSTHKALDMMIFEGSANGAQIAASAGDNMAALGADTRFLGRANEDALDLNSVVKKRISISVANPLVRWGLWLYHSSAASAVPTPLTHLGTAYGVWYQSAALGWAVDLTETTDTYVIVSGFFSGLKATDGLPTWPNAVTAGTNQYAPVWASPILASCALVR